MSEDEAALLIRNILRETLADPHLEINVDQLLVDDLNCDSLDLVELQMELEERLDQEIPDADVENLKTVGDAIAYVVNRTAPATP